MGYNMLKSELRRALPSWIAYTLSMIVVSGLFVGMFNLLQADLASLELLMDNLPKEFRILFGIEGIDMSQAQGFYGFLMNYVVLVGAVFGMKLGVGLLSEEPRRKAQDFLLTRPVTRRAIVSSKIAAALVMVVLQNLLLYAVGWLLLKNFAGGSVDMGVHALLSFSVLWTQLFFIGVGLPIAALARRIRAVTPVALGVVFFFFIIELVNESLRETALDFATPFAWFRGSDILRVEQYNPVFLTMDLALFALLTLAAVVIYDHRDMRAA